MTAVEHPQIYLLTPPDFELSQFPNQLAKVLDACDIACLRLVMATRDEDRLSRAADAVREIAHAREVAVVLDTHLGLVERLGLDGVHVHDGAKGVRNARKHLGKDAIVGAYCTASRHDGMNAAEAGADYVAFGPVGVSTLGDGTVAPRDLFAWWSEMIELPVVAEGHLDAEHVTALAPVTDFLAIGEEIWQTEDPVASLHEMTAALR